MRGLPCAFTTQTNLMMTKIDRTRWSTIKRKRMKDARTEGHE